MSNRIKRPPSIEASSVISKSLFVGVGGQGRVLGLLLDMSNNRLPSVDSCGGRMNFFWKEIVWSKTWNFVASEVTAR